MITANLISEGRRANFLPKHFGYDFLLVENEIYNTASAYSEYAGGLWKFYELLDGGQLIGLYMAPDTEESFRFSNAENYSDETVSADALGIIACLYAFSILSFTAAKFSPYYQALREYAYDHPEAAAIFAAID